MAVALTATEYSGTGTGALATFGTGIYANASDQIKVYAAGVLKTIGADYTLNNIGGSGGVDVVGNFTLGSAIYVERVTPITQLVDTQNNETILEDVLDAEFDKLTMIAQELGGKADRAIVFPKGESGYTLPNVAGRAGKVLGFDLFGSTSLLALTGAVITDAALMYFTQSGIGAKTRTAQDKMRERISVKDFGAVGDGVTNDRAAMQAALTAAAALGATLDLCGGAYNCAGGALNVSCDIDGGSGFIIGQMQINASNLLLKNFSIETDNAIYAIYVKGSSGAYLNNITIDGVTATMGASTVEASRLGLNATYVSRLKIINSAIWYGVQLAYCDNYTITNNTFDGEYKNVNELLHASANSRGVVVGNTFRRSLDNFIDLYSSGSRTTIVANRFIGCQCRLGTAVELKMSFSDDPNNTSGPTLGYEEQILIANNVFADISFAAAQNTSVIAVYYIDTRASPPAFTYADAPRNIRITGNIFDGFDGTNQGAQAMIGILAIRCTGLDIEGNIFRNFTKNASGSDFSCCLWVEDCKDVKILNNRGCVKDGSGIAFHGGNSDITSANNHWDTDQATGFSAKYGVLIQKLGSRADPTIVRGKFTGDTFYGTLEGFRQPYYAAAQLTDCKFIGCSFKEMSTFSAFARCKWIGNDFTSSSGKAQAVTIGSPTSISSGVLFTGNSLAPTLGVGLLVYRSRRGTISENEAITATDGIYLIGSNVAGELDYLNIRDNFSVAQTSGSALPRLDGVAAGDSATQQSSNNQKVAS